MTKISIIGRILALAVCLGLITGPASAAGPEEELGPEKMAIADEIVEKVIYGIRFEKLRGEKLGNYISN